MATDTAAVPAPAHTEPARQFWQVPLLVIGVAAFLSVWQGWVPLGRNDPGTAFARDVAALQECYEKVNPDPGELKTHLARVAQNIDTFPARAAAARFHLGSGYVRLAEITDSPDEAYGYWALALQHFGLVKPEQLRDPADAPRLAFRRAKAEAAAGLPPDTPPAEIALRLQVLTSAQPHEEGGETHRLVADLALRQTPPDLARAKASLAKYLASAGLSTPPASLARARLRLADLYLRERDHEQARRWLEQIGPDAPPDVLGPAKAMLGHVLMAGGNFTAAAKEWETLRRAPGIPQPLRIAAAFHLAQCKLKENDESAARALLEEATKAEGEEAVAAAVTLAVLNLRHPDPAKHKTSVELLTRAVKGPGKFANELVPVNELQAAFELAVATLLTDGAFEPALKAAEVYAVVATGGRDREKKAEVLAAWGTSLAKLKSTDPNDDPRPKFKAAGDEFARLIEFRPKAEGKVEVLRRAAALYRQAEASDLAVAVLRQAVKTEGLPEPLVGPTWLEYGEALLAAGQLKEIWDVYNEVLAAGGLAATSARYRLARVFVDSRHPGLVPFGRALFEQIADQKDVRPEEREYHERSLTELANDLIRQGNFVEAETRLRTQLALYKSGPESDLARLLLGVCLLQRASGATVPAAEAMKLRTEAITTFKQIIANADAAERRTGKLSEREAWLRTQAGLRVLQTYQQMKKPVDLLDEAAKLLDRHKNTVEELIILSLVYHAFKQLDQAGQMLQTRDRMREVFDNLLPSAFTQATGEYSREYWLKVWFPPEK